jgi:hypothetical protein
MKQRIAYLTGAALIAALTVAPATPASAFPYGEDCEATDSCDDVVHDFCSSPLLADYDAIGDCESDILNGTVPQTVPYAPPPAVTGWEATVTDEVEVEP